MTAVEPPPRAPWTIPLAEGPVAPWLDRAVAVLVAGAATTATVLLRRIAPSPSGYDTHVQLGLSPCGWPLTYGIPCPTCGCTTAACWLVHGSPLRALLVQPFGALLALAGLLAGLHALYCLLRRRSFVDLLVRLPFWSLTLGAFAALLLGWLYKYVTFTP